MKFKKFDIFLFSLLLFLYIIINDIHIYFVLIYILLLLYYIYKLYRYIRFESNQNIYNITKSILLSVIHFLFSYLVIYDHNPFYYLFTFYLPFQYFFKSVFIIMFHSYTMAKLTEIQNCKGDQLINSPDYVGNVQIWNSENFTEKSSEFFLSDIFNYLKNNKKRLVQLIACLISIKIIIFYYESKLWIYFNKKENILPITTSKNTKYYITACVLNMENIIIDYINEIKKLINYLGENNIIISIVENGDSKDNTRQYLKEFKQYLDSKNIPNKFVLEHETEDPRNQKNITIETKNYGRILYLSILRNRCFDFIYQIPNLDFENLKIINFNDIVFSYEDIIKLLSTNKEDYDAVCAMDFYFNFYDNWVSIDLDGDRFLKNFPYIVNKIGQDLYIDKKPIRIFSCWNGVIAFNASVLKNKKLEFRVEPFNKSNINLNSPKELNKLKTHVAKYESECTNFHIDMETLGFTKRFINPEIKVAYNYRYYYFSKYILPNTFELLFYFRNYFKSFTTKRNNYMSNMKDKNVNLSSILKNWYIYRKLNNTNLLRY